MLCAVNYPDSRLPNLGAGEREALSLATTIPDSLVILDDALARSYAQQLNIAITGTLGVLLKGKQSGYVKKHFPVLLNRTPGLNLNGLFPGQHK